MTSKLSAVEGIKADSRFLRGHLAEELENPEPGFSPEGEQLIKLHGFYVQRDREHKERPPTVMGRGRIAGGRLSAEQYLVWDALADEFGDGTLRITTRQCLELHGVTKKDMKPVIQALHRVGVTTQGACGDVVRNVTQAVNPLGRADLALLDGVADRLSCHFLSRANAYPELWLEARAQDPATESEPLMGSSYLPRKFKIALTLAGENPVDLFSNDLGLAATLDGAGHLEGFFVFVGGGQSMAFGNPATFPQLAELLGWIPEAALLGVVEALVATFRDHGNRSDRKQARLKFLLWERGLAWIREEVSNRAGARFETRPLPPWYSGPCLGWHRRVDGTWALGLSLLSGRIAGALKASLRALLQAFPVPTQLTTDQDLILLGIPDQDRSQAETLLAGVELRPSPLRQRALACVALPLCSLAITEAERVLPEVLSELEALLEHHGLADRAPVFRLTGCPNGCARPHTAELALIGQGIGKYALYVGGSPGGDRLAFRLAERVPRAELGATLEPLFVRWSQEGEPGEAFGDFANRTFRS